LYSDYANNLHFSYPGLPYFTKQKNNQLDPYYCSASFGRSRANEEGTSDASESEAALTKGQRASAWSSLRSASCLDLSNCNSDFSSAKCNKSMTNADRVPDWTPLVAAMLIDFQPPPPQWTEMSLGRMVHWLHLVLDPEEVQQMFAGPLAQHPLDATRSMPPLLGGHPMDLTGWRFEEQATDPPARPLKP
jgi:hypothetical protein